MLYLLKDTGSGNIVKERIIIETSSCHSVALYKHLRLYKMRSKVTIQPKELTSIVLVLGSNNSSVLEGLLHPSLKPLVSVADPRVGDVFHRILLDLSLGMHNTVCIVYMRVYIT